MDDKIEAIQRNQQCSADVASLGADEQGLCMVCLGVGIGGCMWGVALVVSYSYVVVLIMFGNS